jgi:NADH-quinone oxidoreductase subunit L
MARFAPLLAASPDVMLVMAVGGALTAGFGAMTALFQLDVKRLLAFSSISQIGFMMLALGVGAPAAAMAHFVVHALFKSLLFLAAGDIAHSAGDDTSIATMHGASKRRPLAFAAFTIGAASLAGLPLVTAGWWSKEEVLDAVLGAGTAGQALWGLALLTAVATATYAFRPVLAALQPGPVDAHPHRPGMATMVPLVLLSFGSLTGGLLVGPIIGLLGGVHPEMPAYSVLLAAAAPLTGLTLALTITRSPRLSAQLAAARHLRQGLQIDVLYHAWFVQPFQRLVELLSGEHGRLADPAGAAPMLLLAWLKRQTIDRVRGDRPGNRDAPILADPVDRGWMAVAGSAAPMWAVARRSQSGRVRHSVMALAGGAAALLILGWMTTWP